MGPSAFRWSRATCSPDRPRLKERSMTTRVAINGFGRVGRQSLKALDRARARYRGRRDQRPGARGTRCDPVQARLDVRDVSGRRRHTDDFLVIDGHSDQGLPGEGTRRSCRGTNWASTSSSRRPAASPTPRGPGSISRSAPRRSSSARRPKARTSPSSSASTKSATTRPPHHIISNASCTTNCLAPPPRSCTTCSASRRG